ncbi:MAG: hypothetical protein QF467_06425 [SAR202 cluster bacterium]|nr:hypothetical protein [SAR202 cluster bacterium]|tara:strand:+ start:346 stop:594 length:249 start_codon:yes stop_codon:yes gene_type:complete
MAKINDYDTDQDNSRDVEDATATESEGTGRKDKPGGRPGCCGSMMDRMSEMCGPKMEEMMAHCFGPLGAEESPEETNREDSA